MRQDAGSGTSDTDTAWQLYWKAALENQHKKANNDYQSNEKDDPCSAGEELQHDYLRVSTIPHGFSAAVNVFATVQYYLEPCALFSAVAHILRQIARHLDSRQLRGEGDTTTAGAAFSRRIGLGSWLGRSRLIGSSSVSFIYRRFPPANRPGRSRGCMPRTIALVKIAPFAP